MKKSRHTSHLRIVPLLFALSLGVASGCSLLVDFEECEVDGDCSATGQCVDGLCEDVDRVLLTNHVVEDTTWTADKVYVLENLIMVVAPATLTIEPGTIVLGRRNTGLVSLAGAKIEAEGTRENPIVFTSDKPPGQRLAGDWAGVGMVGNAKVNRDPFNLRIITDKYDTAIGGSDDSWNCGTMKYVRIEFGGSLVDGEKALDGLTLAACGSKTTVDYVQTHMGDDDGIGIFGGTVDLRHVVSTRSRDDAFDFDTAWRGTAQFLAAQQDVNGEEAIEVENLAEEPTAEPQTNPQIYNFTLIGADRQGDQQVGLFVKLGGKAHFSHGIVVGHKSSGLYIEGPVSAEHARSGEVIVENTLFHNIGEEGTDYFGLIDGQDNGFTDYAIYEAASTQNVFGQDPGMDGAYDLGDPGWMPDAKHTTGRDIDPPPENFDPTAVYRGAFNPGAPAPWTEGWTAYPKN